MSEDLTEVIHEAVKTHLANGGKQELQKPVNTHFAILWAVFILGGGGGATYLGLRQQETPTISQVAQEVRTQVTQSEMRTREWVRDNTPAPEVKQALSALQRDVDLIRSDMKEMQGDQKAITKMLFSIDRKISE